SSLAVVIVKVEGMRSLNSESGHEAGNQRLRRVGRALQEAARESDTVARSHGNAFIVILAHAGVVEAGRFIERVQERLPDDEADFGVAAVSSGTELSC